MRGACAAKEPVRLARSGPLPPGMTGPSGTPSAPGTRLALGASMSETVLDTLSCLAVRPIRGQFSRFFGQSTPSEDPILLPVTRGAGQDPGGWPSALVFGFASNPRLSCCPKYAVHQQKRACP